MPDTIDPTEYQVNGDNERAPFTLKVHRGEGMALLAMDWKNGRPPDDFVGFAIAYKAPWSEKFFWLRNRLSFEEDVAFASSGPTRKFPTNTAPIQKFRWVHFPFTVGREGEFVYRVTPIFMDADDELSEGEHQTVVIRLARETVPGVANATFTRGFVLSQAFADQYSKNGSISSLLPAAADDGLDFTPTHEKADEALAWMGFEARERIGALLSDAAADGANVQIIAYELSLPEVLGPLEAMGNKVRAIIDDSRNHGEPHSAETVAAERLAVTAGADNVKRQNMGGLQHNKVIIVDGPTIKKVLCGSTNFSWRGFFVQSNNALILSGEGPVQVFQRAFEDYWNNEDTFPDTLSAGWTDLSLNGIDAAVTFSPHNGANRALLMIADEIESAQTSVFYSLAFLSQTGGRVREAIENVTLNDNVFVYGISDRETEIELLKPDGNPAPVFVVALSEHLPEPFKSEAKGGGGNRMHHKFVVLDFDTPDARVYLGSYNFSDAADLTNGENLLVVRDRRIVTAYMIEALRTFDHYHFRVAQKDRATRNERLTLKKPPRAPGDEPWWLNDYEDSVKIRDRLLFS